MSGHHMNRKLVLETVIRSPDAAGGYHETWQALGTLWGEIRARSGRQTRGAGGPVAVTSLRVVIRAAPVGHSARPESGQRFRCGTQILRIEAVSEMDTDARFLVCHCEEELIP